MAKKGPISFLYFWEIKRSKKIESLFVMTTTSYLRLILKSTKIRLSPLSCSKRHDISEVTYPSKNDNTLSLSKVMKVQPLQSAFIDKHPLFSILLLFFV